MDIEVSVTNIYSFKFFSENPSFLCSFDANDCEDSLELRESRGDGETFHFIKATKEINDFSNFTTCMSFPDPITSVFVTFLHSEEQGIIFYQYKSTFSIVDDVISK